MAELTIDGESYEIDDLSDEAKAQLVSYRFAEQELSRLDAQVAVFQTAKNAYGLALKEILKPSTSYQM